MAATNALILKPVVTEKSLKLAEEMNQYTFLVSPEANKLSVADKVAETWKVTVEKVKIINLPGKRVRFGRRRTQGQRSGKKKAVITLKPGDKIDLFELK